MKSSGNINDDDFLVVDITEEKTQVNYAETNPRIFHKATKTVSEDDLELALLDSAFSSAFEAARVWKEYFIIQSHLFSEEELACCLDLAEHFIKNRHSLALKLIVINCLEVYRNLNYEIKAIARLTREIFKNLDLQLNIDDHLSSYEFKFSQICFENIFYRDLRDFEFSALSKMLFSEEEQRDIRKEVFNAMAHAQNRYQDSYCLYISKAATTQQKFEFIIVETEKANLDFNTRFKLKCFENEFADYLKTNTLLLNTKELNSCEALAKSFIESNASHDYDNIFNFIQEIKNNGEHLSSISCAVIEILSRLDCKLKSERHLSEQFSKLLIAHENNLGV